MESVLRLLSRVDQSGKREGRQEKWTQQGHHAPKCMHDKQDLPETQRGPWRYPRYFHERMVLVAMVARQSKGCRAVATR